MPFVKEGFTILHSEKEKITFRSTICNFLEKPTMYFKLTTFREMWYIYFYFFLVSMSMKGIYLIIHALSHGGSK